MEKIEGAELSQVWDSLNGKQKYAIVQQLVEFERKFTTARFTAYGSLYYKNDIPSTVASNIPLHLHRGQEDAPQSSDKFVVGPSNSRMYFDDGRSEVDVDRGPCKCYLLLSDCCIR